MSMTRAEAIERLEKLIALYEMASTENKMIDYSGIIDALKFSLSALRPVSREQVERMRGEWQVCFEDWRKQMAGDQCSKCGFQHYGTSTNHYKYCPACGAPMTDEAVESLLKRLEALHETVE